MHGDRKIYHFIDNGTDGDSPKAACEGVCNESADEREEVGGAVEVGEGIGGLYHWQVELLGQICDHIGMEASASKSITYFICCHKIEC